MRIRRAALTLVAAAALSSTVWAGPYADDLSKCLVKSTSAEDKSTLVQWMFAMSSLHPDVKKLSTVTPAKRTELNQHIWTDPVRSEQVLARLPAGRFGEASDLAGACVFLSSAASDYIHGVVLPVDGGWLAR